MELIAQGSSDYRIVIGEQATPSERYAAEELQRFLAEISGVTLPITSVAAERAILVGASAPLGTLGITLDTQGLGEDGFLLKTVGDALVIAGGKRGTLYGVYTLLEDYLGCRWFSPTVSRIPKAETVELPALDRRDVPILEWREPRTGDLEVHGDWVARNKIYGRFTQLEERHGDRLHWEHYVHTFYPILPPEQYFSEHPEYYSLINGERTAYRGQLCLTNPEVLDLTIKKVRQWLEEDPSTSVVSVSQNDWYGYCECPNCAAIDEAEGSHAGTMIWFVNQVAEAIEKDYPHVMVSTLAYQYTRKAPKTFRPRHNVVPVLCSIECCFAHPLDGCERNASFVEDMHDWARISDKLYVWDYVTEFGHYISPWPNLYSLQPNVQFFVNNQVRGLFEQGPGTTSEFAELRTWLLAKLLWNPDLDFNAAMDDFLQGYYGKAGATIREYIDTTHRMARENEVHSHIWSPLNRQLFTPEWVAMADRLFDRAEQDADDADVLQRVQVARLPVEYVKIVLGYYSEDEMAKQSGPFMRLCHEVGITEIREGTRLHVFAQEIRTLFMTKDRYERTATR